MARATLRRSAGRRLGKSWTRRHSRGSAPFLFVHVAVCPCPSFLFRTCPSRVTSTMCRGPQEDPVTRRMLRGFRSVRQIAWDTLLRPSGRPAPNAVVLIAPSGAGKSTELKTKSTAVVPRGTSCLGAMPAPWRPTGFASHWIPPSSRLSTAGQRVLFQRHSSHGCCRRGVPAPAQVQRCHSSPRLGGRLRIAESPGRCHCAQRRIILLEIADNLRACCDRARQHRWSRWSHSNPLIRTLSVRLLGPPECRTSRNSCAASRKTNCISSSISVLAT